MRLQQIRPFSSSGAVCGGRRLRARTPCVLVRAQQPASGGSAKQAWAPPTGILKINPELLKEGGLDPSRDGPQAKAAFEQHLNGLFFPVNLDTPGLRVLNVDPPVISVQGFLTHEECDAITKAAEGTGLMKQSGVGVGGYAVKDADNVRTSSTLAATTEVLAEHPPLAAAMGALLARARGLLRGPLPPDGPQLFSKPSAPGQLALELPQVARYHQGQHFLTHEDAFPFEVATAKGYQRRATLLVYLNDCPEGGATKFDILDLEVQPVKGSALLFFPSFANGVPDRRTLHTAQDAVTTKWVTQLWLSCGVRGKQQAQAGGLPSFVRGVKGAPQPPSKGRKRGVPPQRINTKI